LKRDFVSLHSQEYLNKEMPSSTRFFQQNFKKFITQEFVTHGVRNSRVYNSRVCKSLSPIVKIIQSGSYMETLKAVIMGLVQGIAEFLPISSSGHLVLVDHYLKNMGKASLWFDVFLHIATLLVIIVFFWNEFLMLLRGMIKFYKFFNDVESKIFWLIVIATSVTVVVALLMETLVSNIVEKNYKLVGVMLIINSVILLIPYLVNNKVSKDLGSINILDSILIGLFQGVGSLPGISRSGITISTGLTMGLERTTAGVFSFLLFIPTVIGAFVYETYKSLKTEGISNMGFSSSYLIGFVVAATIGYLALWLLMKFLKEGKLYIFSIYSFIVGLLAVIF
jgi:undecaprenyl-diphosphatase